MTSALAFQVNGAAWPFQLASHWYDPGAIEDDDVKKVLSGMTSAVDGIGSLRTHTGSAHGHGRRAYRLEARHARLAIHASHTLVGFFIETWDVRKQKVTA